MTYGGGGTEKQKEHDNTHPTEQHANEKHSFAGISTLSSPPQDKFYISAASI